MDNMQANTASFDGHWGGREEGQGGGGGISEGVVIIGIKACTLAGIAAILHHFFSLCMMVCRRVFSLSLSVVSLSYTNYYHIICHEAAASAAAGGYGCHSSSSTTTTSK